MKKQIIGSILIAIILFSFGLSNCNVLAKENVSINKTNVNYEKGRLLVNCFPSSRQLKNKNFFCQ